MARRVDHLQPHPVGLQHVALLQRRQQPFSHRRFRNGDGLGRRVEPRPYAGAHPRQPAAVVRMAVRDRGLLHPVAAAQFGEMGKHGLSVAIFLQTGVDHGQRAVAHEVDVGADRAHGGLLRYLNGLDPWDDVHADAFARCELPRVYGPAVASAEPDCTRVLTACHFSAPPCCRGSPEGSTPLAGGMEDVPP